MNVKYFTQESLGLNFTVTLIPKTLGHTQGFLVASSAWDKNGKAKETLQWRMGEGGKEGKQSKGKKGGGREQAPPRFNVLSRTPEQGQLRHKAIKDATDQELTEEARPLKGGRHASLVDIGSEKVTQKFP